MRVHALLDGRDVPETSALDYVDALEELLESLSTRDDRDYRDRLGWRADGDHHGSLRGRVVDGRARMGDPRARQAAGAFAARARPSRRCATRARASATRCCLPS